MKNNMQDDIVEIMKGWYMFSRRYMWNGYSQLHEGLLDIGYKDVKLKDMKAAMAELKKEKKAMLSATYDLDTKQLNGSGWFLILEREEELEIVYGISK